MILKRDRKGKAGDFLTPRLHGQANRARADTWRGQTEASSVASLSRGAPCELESPFCSRWMRS